MSGAVHDLDLREHFSWQHVLDMIFHLCGEAADLSFDSRSLGTRQIATAEFRLDAPAAVKLPEISKADGAEVHVWSHGTVVLTDSVIPKDLPGKEAWLLRRNGAGAVTYRAFLESVRVLERLGLPAEFSWSSVPLAPICADGAKLAAKEQAAWSLGAIHTVWLRNGSDEAVCQRLRAIPVCGELRVQNMQTANTWIAGRTDAQALEAAWNA